MTQTNFDTGRNVPARPNRAQTVAELDGSAPVITDLNGEAVQRISTRFGPVVVSLESPLGTREIELLMLWEQAAGRCGSKLIDSATALLKSDYGLTPEEAFLEVELTYARHEGGL
jgi:hypothetical protein